MTYEQVRATYDTAESDNSECKAGRCNSDETLRNACDEQAGAGSKDNGSDNELTQRIFACPSCRQKIRVRLPLPAELGKCVTCQSRFKVSLDDSNNLCIYSMGESNHQHSRETPRSQHGEQVSGKSKEQGPKSQPRGKVFGCPSCQQKIRVLFPLPTGLGKCIACDARFKVSLDEEGNLCIYTVNRAHEDRDFQDYKDHGDDKELTLDDCFLILQLDANANGEAIKAAYRKRMIEYHPDKVSSLGKELKILAERKAKQINLAFKLLKSHGYTC
jgi:hypothetical protein